MSNLSIVFDTIRFKEERSLRQHIELKRGKGYNLPIGWDVELMRYQLYEFTHKGSGLSVTVKVRAFCVAECSLPRILYKDNSRLLKTKTAVNESLALVETILDEIFLPKVNSRIYTRVDIVWHLRGSVRAFIAAYRAGRHPFIYKATVVHEGESIAFPGSAVHIRIYDKVLKATGKQGRFVRVEIQLRKLQLQKLLGSGRPVMKLNWKRSYIQYRELLLKLSPKKAPIISSKASLLACSSRVYDLWASGVDRRTVSRMAPQVTAARLRQRFHKVDFRKLLPKSRPPFPIEF